MATKTSEVLRMLKVSGSITSQEAFRMFDATRLSAIIFNLRKKGYDIQTVMVDATDKYGTPIKYAKYVLHDGWKSLEEYRDQDNGEEVQ